MPIFNFHKMTNMQKGYAYQFSDFITYKKKKNPRINVCVCCVPIMCTQRKQQWSVAKLQTLDCALAFANPINS